jgi:hypothetical protein
MREIVRSFKSDRTHLADIESTHAAIAFGATYRRPPVGTRAICGVHIKDGVVMQTGSKVKCPTCKALAERGL